MNKITFLEEKLSTLKEKRTPKETIQKQIKTLTFILTTAFCTFSLFYLSNFFSDYLYLFWAIPFSYVGSVFLSNIIVQIFYIHYESDLEQNIISTKLDLILEKKRVLAEDTCKKS